MEFVVNRSRRRKRTVSLVIHPQEGLVISAPANTSMARIREIVQDKGSWIVKQLNNLSDAEGMIRTRRFTSGEPLWLLGSVRYLKIILKTKGRKIECREEGQNIEVLVPIDLDGDEAAAAIRDALVRWYKEQASRIMQERIDIYAPVLNAFPSQILIREQKTRWGSCSHKGVIRFNWRIIMAPMELVDYIVVHELCHLKIPNHSPEFWQLVGSVVPDYKERRARLRKEGFYYEF